MIAVPTAAATTAPLLTIEAVAFEAVGTVAAVLTLRTLETIVLRTVLVMLPTTTAAVPLPAAV
jgi:hypothetical protein